MENIYQKLNKHHVIGNDRLLLGPVTRNDAGETFFYASGQENVRWAFIANKSLDKDKECHIFYNPLGRWSIEIKDSEQFVGALDMCHLAEKIGCVGFSYTLNKKFLNQG